MIIAIDFDNTITLEGNYPVTGELNPLALEVIKELKKEHTLILWTCREGIWLDEAVQLLHNKGIEFDYINECPEGTRKVIADVYIDDRAFGGTVDWNLIRKQLVDSHKKSEKVV